MPTGNRVDPFSASHFRVEIDGLTASDFLEVSGMEADVAVVDYRNGTDKALNVRKLPGDASYTNLVLKRGLTSDLSLWGWMKLALDGKAERKNMSVVLMSDTGVEVLRWNFVGAFPVKWSAPMLNAQVSEVAIETLEVAHEGMSLIAP